MTPEDVGVAIALLAILIAVVATVAYRLGHCDGRLAEQADANLRFVDRICREHAALHSPEEQ